MSLVVAAAQHQRRLHGEANDTSIATAQRRMLQEANETGTNCWNTGKCPRAEDECYVRFKTAAAGLAQCRESCPHGWLCEQRVADGGGASCGPAPLPKQLVQPTEAMRDLLSPYGGAVVLCDRAHPPAGPAFEITCFDGGQTGNRYLMVKALLMRAACCAGVALLPPEFDHFPESGASCFDFRGLRDSGAGNGTVARLALKSLGPQSAPACRGNLRVSSKHWWSVLPRETPPQCASSSALGQLVQRTATLYAGFGVAGYVFRDTPCGARSIGAGSQLVVHVRSGDIFSNWRDGEHVVTHGGFQHDPSSRGQPPLPFYASVVAYGALSAAARRPPSGTAAGGGAGAGSKEGGGGEGGAAGAGAREEASTAFGSVLLATSPDRSNPVVHAMLTRANGSATSASLGVPLELSSSASFQQDLSQLLCATNLALARSSLNFMLFDSPNLRNVYSFDSKLGACANAVRCAPPAETTVAAGLRRWCVTAPKAAGAYSVDARWVNSDAQQREMLEYGRGTMLPPALVAGPPLPCAH